MLASSCSSIAMADRRRYFCHLLVTTMLLAASSRCFHTVGATPSLDEELDLKDGTVISRRRVLLDDRGLSTTTQVNSTLRASQAEILLGFRKGVTSDLNGALNNWNTTSTPNPCSWLGVTCDVSGHVSAIDLSSQDLAGTISPSLGNLTFLSSLNLSDNGFNGTIPPSLGQLKHLEYLNLSSNDLERSIPAEISNCSSLTHLMLSTNSLGGFIPSELGRLRNISHIDLHENNLTFSIPISLANCSLLTYLDLSFNNLTGHVPHEMGSLRRLAHLALATNNLTGYIPQSIANCTSLEFLDLSSNNLIGDIVPELGMLRNLASLNLMVNHLTGPIPSALGNLSSLNSLFLGSNQLTENIPPELGKLRNLQQLWIYWTNLTGSIPPELGNLSNLSVLFFYGNGHLTPGPIQPALGNLTKLTVLFLWQNNFNGEIPAWIGGLSQLGNLALNWNQLTGHIPVELGNLTNIWRLLLSHNLLSGPIIPELGQLTTVQELGLDYNNFTGQLPPILANLTKIEYFYVNHNILSGVIPRDMFTPSFQSLSLVNMHTNHFSGPIPEFGSYLNSLITIDLSHNSLSGPLPTSIQNCKALINVNFSNNHLTGELPIAALEQLLSLQDFDVSNNSLVGAIPPTQGRFANVTAADYAGNPGLCGALLANNCTSPSKACHGIRCHREWIYIASGVAAGVLLIVITVFAVCCLKPSKKKVPVCGQARGEIKSSVPTISLYTKELKLTTVDLWKATDGFSEFNILGVGGHSTVYKAAIPDSDVKVIAVKCFNIDPHEQTAATDDFYHELRVFGSLRHRNLVKLHGFCATPPLKALLMEFVPNGSLHMHLHKGMYGCQLSLDTRLGIALGVADAMVYLHHESHEAVIHRDLKPNNILLDFDFNPKVADFGIAKYIHKGSNGEATASGLFGTTGYIAPEYATSNKVSTKGDVYSYGVVLLEMLTGKKPTDEGFALEGTWLGDWVLKAFPDRIPDILDDTLNSQFSDHQKQIHMLTRVGLLCTRDVPKDRPSMKDVLQMLMQVKDPNKPKKVMAKYPTFKELTQPSDSAKQPPEYGLRPPASPNTIDDDHLPADDDSTGSSSVILSHSASLGNGKSSGSP